MIIILISLLLIYMGVLLWFFIFPIKFIRRRVNVTKNTEIPDFYIYSFQLHIHTQFSYDSLGRVEDVLKAKEENSLDFVIISDHRNKDVEKFASNGILVGVEKREHDENGIFVGDVIELEDIKVIAHPFNPKYLWKAHVERGTFFEIIDIKDILKEKGFLIIFLFPLIFPFLGKKSYLLIRRVIDIRRSVERVIKRGWVIKSVAGLDHHVKFYYIDSNKKFLFPDYRISFKILRNFLVSRKHVKEREEFLNALKEGYTIVSFTEKPIIVWTENKYVKLYCTEEKVLWIIHSYGGRKYVCEGSEGYVKVEPGEYIIYGYRYLFRLGGMYFGLKPYFITSTLEVKDGGGANT